MNKLKQMETALSPGGGQQAVDQMDNQTLLLRYKETGDMELKWALVLRYTDLVRRIAIQTCGLFSGFTQLVDDVHQNKIGIDGGLACGVIGQLNCLCLDDGKIIIVNKEE